MFDLHHFFVNAFEENVTCVNRTSSGTTEETTYFEMNRSIFPATPHLIHILWICMIVFTCILITRELTKVANMGFAYFARLAHYGVLLIITSFLLCMHHSNPFKEDYTPRWYQYHFAAFGTFFTWIEMFYIVGQTPRFGVYMEMMITVTRSILHLFIVFLFIFVAFATSFTILFPSHFEYQSNIIVAMAKVSYISFH